MSILLKKEIHENFTSKRIVIEPFCEQQLGPNSYDVCLGSLLTVYTTSPLDPLLDNPTHTFEIPPDGFTLQPGILYLGSTVEVIGSDYFIPMYEGRSSMARLGVQSHISAGFGDIGFISQWTLEITVVRPVVVRPGMKIGQVYFHRVDEQSNVPENRYNGKYKSQKGPTKSLFHQEGGTQASPFTPCGSARSTM